MKGSRIIVSGLLAMVIALLAVGAAASFGSSGNATRQSGKITIQSWLLASPSTTGLAGTVKACFKLSGAHVDRGGQPTWSNQTYDATPASLTVKCKDWTPVGGFNFVPPAAGQTDSTLYAVHTITGQQGQIDITFAGTYDLVKTFTGSGTWVVTGGSGIYQGARGEGTWTADATKFPFIRHTETGTLSLLSGS